MVISRLDKRPGFIQNMFRDPEGMKFLGLCSKLLFLFFWVKVHFDAVWLRMRTFEKACDKSYVRSTLVSVLPRSCQLRVSILLGNRILISVVFDNDRRF